MLFGALATAAAASAAAGFAATAVAACETRATSAEAVMTESCKHLANLSFSPSAPNDAGSDAGAGNGQRTHELSADTFVSLRAFGPTLPVSVCARLYVCVRVFFVWVCAECNCRRLTSDQSAS